jgi:iron(III) transport system substrate-binding protein
MKARSLRTFGVCLLAATLGGCAPEVPKQVAVYTTLEEAACKPIFDAFTRQTGIAVVASYSAGKSDPQGLAGVVLAEREKPQADVLWSDEPLATLLLKQAGVLRKQPLAADKNYPAENRSKDYDWRGFASRARVLLVNTNLVKEARWPRSLEDLTDAQWYDRCGIATPLNGASAAHAAGLFQAWGAERAQKFFLAVKNNCRLLSDDKRVAQEVARGELAFGLTSSDAAMAEVEAGQPVAIVYPDQPKADEPSEAVAEAPNQPKSPTEVAAGTLYLPSTVALLEGSPQPEAGHALAEFLLTSLVECRLVIGPGAHVPLSRQSQADNSCRCRIKSPDEVQTMAIDWQAAAAGWDAASKWLAQEFGGK